MKRSGRPFHITPQSANRPCHGARGGPGVNPVPRAFYPSDLAANRLISGASCARPLRHLLVDDIASNRLTSTVYVGEFNCFHVGFTQKAPPSLPLSKSLHSGALADCCSSPFKAASHPPGRSLVSGCFPSQRSKLTELPFQPKLVSRSAPPLNVVVQGAHGQRGNPTVAHDLSRSGRRYPRCPPRVNPAWSTLFTSDALGFMAAFHRSGPRPGNRCAKPLPSSAALHRSGWRLGES